MARMAFRKILCPIDFSVGSHQAMLQAASLAKQSDAELVLAHACHLPPVVQAELAFPADTMQDMIEDAERGLAAAAADVTGLDVRRVTTRLVTGVPWEQIVELVRSDLAIDLAVLGTQGKSGLDRVLLGSVAERVVRHAPCPVLTVPARGQLSAFEHILCPVDFSQSARRAVALATEIAAARGSRITLLHVLELPVAYSGELAIEGLAADLDRRAAELLEDWARSLGTKVSQPVVTRTRIGYPGAQILSALDADRTFDLVVTGSHGRTGLRRALLGSVAEKLVRHARCPVLVAHARTA